MDLAQTMYVYKVFDQRLSSTLAGLLFGVKKVMP